ncbi:hypothetical protein SD51_10640 [Alicyclobacillus tengchongensis]|nr:hypothetical protein SD51_10640 [Alicyclobacillus tengchongensis]
MHQIFIQLRALYVAIVNGTTRANRLGMDRKTISKYMAMEEFVDRRPAQFMDKPSNLARSSLVIMIPHLNDHGIISEVYIANEVCAI